MRIFRKTKAFTLTELLIGLVITSIVVSLSYVVIMLVVKNIGFIGNNYQKNTEILLLEQQLSVDFNMFPNIESFNDSEIVWFSSPLDSIRYQFSEKYIIRIYDTILQAEYNKQLYFKGNEIQKGYMDAIKLNISEVNKFLFIYKQNDATTLLINDGLKN